MEEKADLLSGLLVIDMTNNIAGPCAGLLLAERGAEVIHIERPGSGDDNRRFLPMLDGTSLAHMWANSGKKSVTLDLKDEKDLALLNSMLMQADVLIESYRPGVMDKIGLGYDAVKKQNSRLIYCSISAFGHSGPYTSKPGYDIIAQAYSGIMYMTGEKNGPPIKSGMAIGDFVGAINAFGSIMTALYYREKTGLGQHVDISLARGLLWFNGHFNYPVTGQSSERTGNHAWNIAPYGVFNGKDGSVVIGALTPNTWEYLCKAIGREDLCNNPAYCTNDVRCTHIPQIIDVIETWLKTFDHVADACEILDHAGVPVSKINSPDDLYTDPHATECQWIQPVQTPDSVTSADVLPVCTGLADFSRGALHCSSAPDLGQNNSEIKTRFGTQNKEQNVHQEE